MSQLQQCRHQHFVHPLGSSHEKPSPEAHIGCCRIRLALNAARACVRAPAQCVGLEGVRPLKRSTPELYNSFPKFGPEDHLRSTFAPAHGLHYEGFRCETRCKTICTKVLPSHVFK